MKEGDGRRKIGAAITAGVIAAGGSFAVSEMNSLNAAKASEAKQASETPTVKKDVPCDAPRLGDNEPEMLWDQVFRPGEAEARDLTKQGYCVNSTEQRYDAMLGNTVFAKVTEGNCDNREVPVTSAEFPSSDPYDLSVTYKHVPAKRVDEKVLYTDGTDTGKRTQHLEPLKTKEEFRGTYDC